MAVFLKFGYPVCDEFERFYQLVMTCIPFIYTNKYSSGKFMPFNDKTQGHDKWKLKNWFRKSEVLFIDPKNCYDTEKYKLVSKTGVWQNATSIFGEKRFARINDFLMTGLATLADTGHISLKEIYDKIKIHKQKANNGNIKGQSSLSGSLFHSAGREEEYGNTPFFDGINGLANKAAGEKCIFEKGLSSGCHRRQRIPGQQGYISRRGSEVLPPSHGD